MVRKVSASQPRKPVLSERLNLPISREMLDAIDDWRRGQRDIPARPEAVRRILANVVLKGRRSPKD